MIPDLNPRTDFVPAEEMVIEDLKTLKVLSDPLRLRIRELMTEPTTVKLVAEQLKIPATKLYYHIDQLEKHGLIVLVDTRIVSGIIEKHYQISARQVRVARHLLSPGGMAGEQGLNLTLKGIFEDTREDLIASINEGTASLDEGAQPHESAIISSSRLLLTEEQAAEFYERLRQLFNEFLRLSRAHQDAKDKDGHYYKTLLAIFPTSRKHRPGDSPESDTSAAKEA